MEDLDMVIAGSRDRLRVSFDGQWTMGERLVVEDRPRESPRTSRRSVPEVGQDPATDLNVLAIGVDCDDLASLLGRFIESKVRQKFSAEFAGLVIVGQRLLSFEQTNTAGEKSTEKHAVVYVMCRGIHWLIEPQLCNLVGPKEDITDADAQALMETFEPKGARLKQSTIKIWSGTLDLDTRTGSEPDIWWASKAMLLRVIRYLGPDWAEFVDPDRVDDLNKHAPADLKHSSRAFPTNAAQSRNRAQRSSVGPKPAGRRSSVPKESVSKPSASRTPSSENTAPKASRNAR